jgi:hypothetical protein
MNLTTKKKYLKIVNTYNQILNNLGANASYISKGRIMEIVSETLFITEKIKLSRSVFYEALKYSKDLKEEEMYIE